VVQEEGRDRQVGTASVRVLCCGKFVVETVVCVVIEP
jgi:hypothetical protein